MKGAGCGLITLLAALGLVACGGGGESISKDEFIAQADAACTESNTELEKPVAILRTTLPQGTGLEGYEDAPAWVLEPEKYPPAARRVAEIEAANVEEIDALGRPEGDEELIDNVLEIRRQFVEDLGSLAYAVEDGYESSIEPTALEAAKRDFESVKMAGDYGFEVCWASIWGATWPAPTSP